MKTSRKVKRINLDEQEAMDKIIACVKDFDLDSMAMFVSELYEYEDVEVTVDGSSTYVNGQCKE